MVERPAVLYSLEAVALTKSQEVAELKMVIRNEYIRGTARIRRLETK